MEAQGSVLGGDRTATVPTYTGSYTHSHSEQRVIREAAEAALVAHRVRTAQSHVKHDPMDRSHTRTHARTHALRGAEYSGIGRCI